MTNQPHSGTKPHLTLLAAECSTGTCPTVYRTDRETVLVQGYIVSAADAGLDLPPGEQLVEIPLGLLATAAANSTI
ncbi:hypothetical protein [Paractinoplanes abujensis]|uniref:Uncharacterized protein n=1 Tax=Paractinoplanes abujensis TaxID=882441 RepID=A0A7W7CTL5_9ACTN|nr:hypothetical protein [Actinoplanes abujensis]MBB4694482.1 hypothetical protein [Actinoplanes abujensis]